MPTSEDNELLRAKAEELNEAKKDYYKSVGSSWAQELNTRMGAKTSPGSSGAGGSIAPQTNNGTAVPHSAAGSAATRQVNTTLRPPSTDASKL
jgi:hypothetical protein